MNAINETRLFLRFRDTLFPKYLRENLVIMFGFECGDGWYDLLYQLFENLEEVVKKLDLTKEPDFGTTEIFKFCILQVKEKYGGLRVYTNWETEEIADLISNAEKESFNICEVCGSPGKLRTDVGWIKVYCDLHHETIGKNVHASV